MCIFCDIVEGKVPSSKVYEDESVFAFLDISPVNYGHTLVIPKKHYENIEEIPEDELCNLTKIIKRIGKKVLEGLAIKGYNIQLNNGVVAGQVVPHIHFHIIPRNEGDGLKLWPGGKYGEGEMDEILKKIKIVQ